MKGLSLITVTLFIMLSLWIPARNDAALFEETALREALRIETGKSLPPASLSRPALKGIFVLYDAVSGFVPDYRVRPNAPDPEDDPWERMNESGRNTLRTPYFRSLRSFAVMTMQRWSVLCAAFLFFLPFTAACLADGLVLRRINAAKLRTPRPTVWFLCVRGLFCLVSASILLPMFPLFPIELMSLFPIAAGFLIRSAAAVWHRFL